MAINISWTSSQSPAKHHAWNFPYILCFAECTTTIATVFQVCLINGVVISDFPDIGFRSVSLFHYCYQVRIRGHHYHSKRNWRWVDIYILAFQTQTHVILLFSLHFASVKKVKTLSSLFLSREQHQLKDKSFLENCIVWLPCFCHSGTLESYLNSLYPKSWHAPLHRAILFHFFSSEFSFTCYCIFITEFVTYYNGAPVNF